MLVSEVVQLAIDGELSQLAIRKRPSAVISFINLGVLELYKRFPLKQEEAIITLANGKTIYTMDGNDPAVSMESANNFLIISECYDMHGDPVPINDEQNILGIMTPSYNTIEVPNIVEGERLNVIYRTSPKFVTTGSDQLQLPLQLLEALLYYVGFKGHGTVTSDIKTENNTHYMRYDQSCNRVENDGLILVDDLISYNFEARGFV
jgi:hypothetical protein